MPREPEATPQIIWENIAFFAGTGLVSLVGVPLYLIYFDLHPFTLWLFVFYLAATGLSVSAGYHRLFSHATYTAHPAVQWFFLFFGAAAFQHSALRWSSQHRDHHNFVASEEDPYSIKKGFWYAHIGWLMFWRHRIDFQNVEDLSANPLIAHQHRYYRYWAFVAGVLTPLVIGALYGDLLGAFIFAACLRFAVVHHATFCVNSVCHMFGKEPYDLISTARDNWLVALFTNGEGHHNYHHRFPSDYRNGVFWYQWDLAKWLIALLKHMRLATDLKRVSKFRIINARLETTQRRFRDWLTRTKSQARLEQYYADHEKSYKELRKRLTVWEERSKEYGELTHGAAKAISKVIRRAAKQRVNIAKLRYRHSFKQRKQFTPPP